MIFRKISEYLHDKKFPKIPLRDLEFKLTCEKYGETVRGTRRYITETMHITDPVEEGDLVSRNWKEGSIIYMILKTKKQEKRRMRIESEKATAIVYPIGKFGYNPAAKKHCKKTPLEPLPAKAKITLEELP